MNLSGGTAMYIARSFRKRWLAIVVTGLFIIATASLFMALNRQSSATVYGEPVKWKQVSAGGYHTCAISENDQVYCWGANNVGQLGNAAVPSGQDAGSSAQGTAPVPVDTSGVLAGKRIVKISAGMGHTCAMADDGKAYCWGFNGLDQDGDIAGQLGHGSTELYSNTPVEVYMGGVLSGKTITDISAGKSHTCAIASDNRVYCWGTNILGVLGNDSIPTSFAVPALARSLTPVAVGVASAFNNKRVIQIDAGDMHTCAGTDEGKVYCWGVNDKGQLGSSIVPTGSYSYSVAPVLVTGLENTFGKISAGGNHTCLVKSSSNDSTGGGELYCWGMNSKGQLGNNSTQNSPTPIKTLEFVHNVVVAGSSHTCAVGAFARTICWGENYAGQLGNGTTAGSLIPKEISQGQLPSGVFLEQISAGYNHVCAVASSKDIYCWGSNVAGMLGTGNNSNSPTPAALRQVIPSINISQSTARVYRSSSDISPGLPLEGADTTALLTGVGESFRLRIGITNNGPSVIPAARLKLRAEYAQKQDTGQCRDIQQSSWRRITTDSAIAYAAIGPPHATAITVYGRDPILPLPSGILGYARQSIVRPTDSDTTFTNNKEIAVRKVGLWDLALTDRSLTQGKEYCIRLVTDTQAAPGTSIDTYTSYPVIRAAVGSLDIRFTNTANATITNPTTHFGSIASANTTKSTSAMLSNSTSQQLEVKNTTNVGGWTVALSAAGGSAARWRNGAGTASYAFNGAQAASGRLLVDMSNGSFSAISAGGGQGCDATGLSFNGSASFVAGTATANAVTIASAAQNSKRQCAFRLQNIRLSQTIPAYQKPDTYTLPMTLTVTAQ